MKMNRVLLDQRCGSIDQWLYLIRPYLFSESSWQQPTALREPISSWIFARLPFWFCAQRVEQIRMTWAVITLSCRLYLCQF
jgi:hypothetical protein